VGEARHPRAGTGTGGYYHGRYPYGGHGHHGYYGYGHGHGYYGYYRPYYHPYASFYFGWPYYNWGWGPYASVGYYDAAPSYAPAYGNGYEPSVAPPAGDDSRYEAAPPPPGGYEAPPNTGRVRLEVRPNDSSVYVDDEFWGSARETKSLILRAGPHSFELVRPGFATVRREVEVVKGETVDLLVELLRP
jgi:hypothetical protein